MSESLHLSDDNVTESASDATASLAPTTAPLVGTNAHTATSEPLLTSPSALPVETRSILETIDRGLAGDADDATRAAARDLWTRLAPALAAVPSTAGAPAMPAAPALGPPIMPSLPSPASPLVMAAHALKQLSPDQLLDMVLGRLRAALPAGATVPTPRGIQFQLVPVPLSDDGR